MIGFVIIIGSAVLICFYYLLFSQKSQILGAFPYIQHSKEKVVALTFDDGPNPPFTEELLAVLKKHGVRASFFLVGRNVQAHPHLAKQVLEQGHVVANHSANHKFFNYCKSLSFEKEVAETQSIIQTATGKTPALFRPPWLYRQPWLLKNLQNHGLIAVSGLYGCELEPFQPPAKLFVWRTLMRVKPGTIFIFHDGIESRGGYRGQTIKGIDLLIPRLKQQGYRFATVDELLGVGAYNN